MIRLLIGIVPLRRLDGERIEIADWRLASPILLCGWVLRLLLIPPGCDWEPIIHRCDENPACSCARANAR